MGDQKKDEQYMIIGIIVVVVLLVLLLSNHCSFNFSSQVFNNIFSPLLLFLTLIIMYLQLRNTLSNEEYRGYKEDLKDRINIFKTIKFKPNIKVYQKDSQLITSIEESNGIDYSGVFANSSLGIYDPVKQNPEVIADFKINFLFPLYREYVVLFDLLSEINENKSLSISHKMRLYKKIEMDLLQVYFKICNKISPNINDNKEKEEKEYNLTALEGHYFKKEDFYKINNFYIENELFQYHTLEFYKKEPL